MQENPLILSEYEEINYLLYKPIITTKRIKYTCINISTNHIVLGSTSGSLYLFTRDPCKFQQLIPLSEGPVVHVLISPDEKTIALATKRGSVCLINLKPTIKLLSVSNEHINETITCLCWNEKSTEIYVGNSNGKISTIVLSIFTVNGMFQPPSCALMHLDSSVVQIDFSMHYLLVSTLTRCYICDTAQEKFKQIGNKTRDGKFGACFFKNINENKKLLSSGNDDQVINKASTLNSVDGLNDSTHDEQKNIIIYCARPGCRLWEVTTSGIVIKTHQFKDALAVPPSSIYITSAIKLSREKTNNKSSHQQINQIQLHNFSRLIVYKEYLLSYTLRGLYIIDPVNAAVILWCDEFTDISMAHIIDDKIYLMTFAGFFYCLTLSNIDSLIVKFFNYKLYNDCLKLCTIYRGDLLKLIDCNRKVIQVDDGEIKLDLNNLQIDDIMSILQSIIAAIKPNLEVQPHRLISGIVMVHSGDDKFKNTVNNRSLTLTETKHKFDVNNCMKDNQAKVENEYESTSDSEIICNNTISMKKKLMTIDNQDQYNYENIDNISQNISQMDSNHCDNLENSIENNKQKCDESTCNVLQKDEIEIATSNIQMDVEPVNILIATLKPPLTLENIENIAHQIDRMITEINNKYGEIIELKQFLYEIIRSVERHYHHILLENITIDLLLTTDNIIVLNEIIKAFININISNYIECSCGNPRAKNEELIEPKFFELGQALIRKLSKENNHEKLFELIKSVPYLLREYLSIYVNENGIIDDKIIRLCLQTRDNVILSILLQLLNSKQWEITIECIKRMQTNRCLFCNEIYKTTTCGMNKLQIDWSKVANEIIKKQKPDDAMKLLELLESKLPTIKLKPNVFQSLIFTKLLNHHGFENTIELDHSKVGNNEFSSLCSVEVRNEIAEALERDLERPINKNVFGNGAHHWGIHYKPKSSICPSCTLSLQTPVLLGDNGISIFPCGHAYHVNCLIQKKLTTCLLHQK